MAKIKEITITDFRAYEGSHRFSFKGRDGLANLLMIYAPNGFGKTSFFDAVEWAYVNRIRRFEHRVSKEEVEQRAYSSDDRILLTNRSAAKKGKHGIIRITTDNDQFVERHVDPRNSKEKFRYDYRQAKLTGSFNQKELSGLPENNILTQDQIDAFLRFTTPDEKFTALKDFWPQGSEATTIYRRLTNYQKLTDQALDSIKKELKKLRGQVNELVNKKTDFGKVNQWVVTLNANFLIDINFQSISEGITENVYNSMVNLNETYRRLVGNELDKFRIRAVKFAEMINEGPTYLSLLNEIDIKQKALINLKAVQSDHIGLNSASAQADAFTLTIRKLTGERSDMNYIIENWGQYLLDLNEISVLRRELDTDRNNNEIYLADIRCFENSLANISNWLDDLQTELESEKQRNEKIELNVKEIIKLNNDIFFGSNRLDELEIADAEYQSELNGFLLQKIALQQIAELSDETPETFFPEIAALFSERKHQLSNLNYLQTQLEEAQAQHQLKNSFNEGLERILKWGSNQVTAMSLTNCPMCQTEFGNVEDLLKAISADKSEILKLTELEERINYISLVELDLKNEITFIECRILSHVREKMEANETNIQEFQLNKTLIAEQRHQANQNLSYARNAIAQLSRIFSDEELLEAIERNDYQPIKVASDQKLRQLTKKMERLGKIIDWKRTALRNSNNLLLNSRNLIETKQNKIQLLNSREVFNKIEVLLSEYEFDPLVVNLEQLKSIITRINQTLKEEEAHLAEANLLIDSLKSKTSNYQNELNSAAINGTIQNRQNELSDLQTLKEKFETEYNLLLSVNVISLEKLSEAQKEVQMAIKDYESLLEQLTNFALDLAVVQGNFEKLRLQGLINEKLAEEQKLKTVKAKVDLAKNKSGEYIKNGIENYFNKDAINNIYGMIEPHPRLTAIDFKPDITEKVPKLQIMAKSEQEELNPNLFFSTGQINVLSLSIFLAKACELGSQKISTIFMDDPVQNLSDINVLSFIDLLRMLIKDQDKQIVISTHDEKFYNLVKNKLSDRYFPTKFIELESYGKIKEVEIFN